METKNIKYIYDYIVINEKKFIVTIEKDRISITIHIENVDENRKYKNIITWNDIHNKKIDNLDKYFIFLKKIFLKEFGFSYKINEVNMCTSFSKNKELWLTLNYESDFFDFNDSCKLTEIELFEKIQNIQNNNLFN
jgi:hypothetical protein